MAITVVTRPIGHKLSETPNIATITSSYSGVDGFFVKANHGLVDGDYIYATSEIEDYNGFWYVDQISTDAFKLKEGPGSDFLQWVADGSITYYVSTEQHGWSCVHLPIVYKLTNDLWPTNTANTARTVSSFTDSNGYVNLNLSGILNGTVNDLDYVKISGAADDTLNGVFQITDAVSTSDVTINLAYDAGYSFAGATVQYYYNNYHMRVKVYGGLASDHQYEYLKPYRELAELRLIPDENNEVMFSVSELLKSLINTRNNLLLASLPCNLDFFTQFYISYADSFDSSDGTTIVTEVGSYTSDQENLEGYAVNAKLEFKNMYSGFLTEYLDKFLTLLETPLAFPGQFFDLSFINSNEDGNDVDIVIKKYLDDSLITTETIQYSDPGAGVLRAILEISGDYDMYCIQAVLNSGDGFTPATLPDVSTWSNINDAGPIWSIYAGANPIYLGMPESNTNALGLNVTSDKWYTLYSFEAGRTYTFSYSFDAVSVDKTFTISILDGSMVVLISKDEIVSGTLSGSYSFVAPVGATGISVHFFQAPSCGSGGDQCKGFITSFVNETASVPPTVETDITEELCIDIDNKCSNQSIYLTWLNNLGGFDYLEFTAKKDHIVEIQESGITTQNIFPSWPQSYSSIADTIRKQTFRTSNKAFTIRSQHLTASQVDAVSYIKSSVLVQILVSRSDRRTVIVDTDSFVIRKDGDDTYAIAFNISYTDDIPAQTV